MDDEVRFILPYTIHGMSNELHLILQGPACPTMLVYDTKKLLTLAFFCFWWIYSPPNLTYKPKSVVISNCKFQISNFQ